MISSAKSFVSNEDLRPLLSALQSDQTVLHYRIIDAIGEGGMGKVYKAEDHLL